MAEIITNNELETDSGKFKTILTPTDKLAQGIKAMLSVYEDNGVPKYSVDDVLKIFGTILKVNGVERTSVDFTSDPQEQINGVKATADGNSDMIVALQDEDSRLAGLINSLDSTKADSAVALIFVDLGIKDLVHNNTFSIDNIQRLAKDTAYIIEISDNVTGRHRMFARTSLSADANTITYCEVVDMGTKKAPSINEIEVNVANGQGTYMEMPLQPRLPQIDLDNIASIPQINSDIKKLQPKLIFKPTEPVIEWKESDMASPFVVGKKYRFLVLMSTFYDNEGLLLCGKWVYADIIVHTYDLNLKGGGTSFVRIYSDTDNVIEISLNEQSDAITGNTFVMYTAQSKTKYNGSHLGPQSFAERQFKSKIAEVKEIWELE